MEDAAKQQDKKKRTQMIVLAIVGVFIVAAIYMFNNMTKFVNYDYTLTTSATAVNLVCPQMIDEDTRLDSVSTEPGRRYLYHYTALNLDRETLDMDRVCDIMRETILENMKGDMTVAEFGKNNVTLVYNFNDKYGEHLCSIDVAPADYYRKAKKTPETPPS